MVSRNFGELDGVWYYTILTLVSLKMIFTTHNTEAVLLDHVNAIFS